MKTINRTNSGKYILRNDNLKVKAMFSMGKIWLTIKEIADFYGVNKSEVKKELSNIIINSNLDLSDNIQKVYNSKKDETDTFYSLDVLLLLGYRSKHYKETKFLVNSNKLLREYTNSRQYRTGKSETILGKIINMFQKVA
ncbi:MAG: sporulation transcriptional regulator SpoIIID [Candidatus Gracilibacteria bacterium]|nr:sporulation transcriptional regulator SpoIIID [Candidatus Gracilibacteria bacterium]